MKTVFITSLLVGCCLSVGCDSVSALRDKTCAELRYGKIPNTLQLTGCFAEDGTPAPILNAYRVNSPLFADGAGKGRWLMLPPNETATFNDENVLQMPAGTAVFKEFSLNNVRLETRLLLLQDDGAWEGFSFAWNEAQDLATLLTAGATATVKGQSWTYPSRSDCLTCHNQTAGSVLGLQEPELNLMTVTGHGAHIAQLQGMVGNGELAQPAPLGGEAWPDPLGEAPLGQRARSYLAANCSYCHRPNGVSGTQTNFLYDTPLSQMGICNVAPTFGTFGVPNVQLLTPGNPSASILSYRMHSVEAGERMPPLGRHLEDTAGVAVIDAWIASLQSCFANN